MVFRLRIRDIDIEFLIFGNTLVFAEGTVESLFDGGNNGGRMLAECPSSCCWSTFKIGWGFKSSRSLNPVMHNIGSLRWSPWAANGRGRVFAGIGGLGSKTCATFMQSIICLVSVWIEGNVLVIVSISTHSSFPPSEFDPTDSVCCHSWGIPVWLMSFSSPPDTTFPPKPPSLSSTVVSQHSCGGRAPKSGIFTSVPIELPPSTSVIEPSSSLPKGLNCSAHEVGKITRNIRSHTSNPHNSDCRD